MNLPNYDPNKPQTHMAVFSDRTGNVTPLQLFQASTLPQVREACREKLSNTYVQASIYALIPYQNETTGTLPGLPMMCVSKVHPSDRITSLIEAAISDIAFSTPREQRSHKYTELAVKFTQLAATFQEEEQIEQAPTQTGS